MGMIKPQDIQNVSFHKTALGYSKEEVDAYLDEVAVGVQALWREIEDLKSDIQEQAQRIENYRNIEEDLKNTFILAQQSAGEIRENAVRESEMLIKENEMKVEEILTEGQRRIDEMQERYNNLNRKYTSYRAKMKADLKMLLDMISEEDGEEDL